MHRLVRLSLKVVLLALLLSTGSALAQDQDGNLQGENQDGRRARASSAASVPEFGPAAAGAIAALVAGGGLLLARRHRR